MKKYYNKRLERRDKRIKLLEIKECDYEDLSIIVNKDKKKLS